MVVGLLKRLLKCPCDTAISDEEVLYRTGSPSPSELLRIRRLRYFGSLCSLGTTACWGLLNEDQSWLTLLHDDFAWMWTQIANCSELGDPKAHLPRWIEIATWHRGYWRRLIRRALTHAIGVQAREYLVCSAHVRILQQLEEEKLIQQVAPPSPAPGYGTVAAFGCMLCRKFCRSAGGEGAHMHRVHQISNPVCSLIAHTQCEACLTE